MRFVLVLSAAVIVLLIIAALIALSRHKKSGTGRIQLLDAEGILQSELCPEGTVLVEGELWRARSLDGTSIACPGRVKVVAVDGHLLVVKRYASTRPR